MESELIEKRIMLDALTEYLNSVIVDDYKEKLIHDMIESLSMDIQDLEFEKNDLI
jgi:hypothetical protein